MFEGVKDFLFGALPWVVYSVAIAFFAVYSEKDKEKENEK